MHFHFNIDELNKGTLDGLQVYRAVGAHSILLLDYTLNGQIPDLGRILGGEVKCWIGSKEKKEKLIFHGIIIGVDHTDSQDSDCLFRIEAQSKSVLADMVLKSQVFQDSQATLQNIIDSLKNDFQCKLETTKNKILQQKNDLSIQFDETNFEYLKRIVEIHGIPVIMDDLNDTLYVGVKSTNEIKINDHQILEKSFHGNIVAFRANPTFGESSGVLGKMQASSKSVFDTHFSDVFPTANINSVYPNSKQNSSEVIEATNSSRFYHSSSKCVIETGFLQLSVGSGVKLDDDDTAYSLVSTRMTYSRHFGAKSTHTLIASSSIEVDRDPITSWRTDAFLATVVENTGDPERLGRVQVSFDWEKEDNEKCWVQVLTPYSGFTKETSSGLIALPEIGEHVIVRFFDGWDDKPYIIGSFRKSKIPEGIDTAKSKLLLMPKGTQVRLSSDENEEKVQIRAGDGDKNQIEVISTEGKMEVMICSPEGDITIDAKNVISIKAEQVKIEGKQNVSVNSPQINLQN